LKQETVFHQVNPADLAYAIVCHYGHVIFAPH
jgi:hypothetical protein